MTFKFVGRKAPGIYRLFRVTWSRGKFYEGGIYDMKLSFALVPCLFGVRRDFNSYEISILGLRIHYKWTFAAPFVEEGGTA